MWAIEELTMDDFDGRLIWERFGSNAARSYSCDRVRRYHVRTGLGLTKNLLFKVSRR